MKRGYASYEARYRDERPTETRALLRVGFAHSLSAMTPLELITLWLRWVMGMSYDQIGEIMHCSRQATAARVRECKLKIKATMCDEGLHSV